MTHTAGPFLGVYWQVRRAWWWQRQRLEAAGWVKAHGSSRIRPAMLKIVEGIDLWS